MNNNNPCADFAQSKFHLEFFNFLEHVKQTYPSELNRVNNLNEKFKLFIEHSLMNIDVLDELTENLSKARSLVIVAMTCSDLTEIDTKTINNYLWVLEDLLTNAQKIIANNNP